MSPESTLKKANIKLLESQTSEGVGGGGKFRSVPFVVEELNFGEAREKNVPGSFSGPFPVGRFLRLPYRRPDLSCLFQALCRDL